jgi:hypothetical protein
VKPLDINMTTTQILKITLAGALALLAACNDTTGNGGTDTGSLSFTYSGARAGTYSASGRFQARSTSFAKQPFAIGARSSEAGVSEVAVLSYLPVTTSTGHMLLLGLPGNSGTGSYSFDDSGCSGEDLDCAFALLLFDTNPDLEEDDSQVFAFTTGTVNVTSNTSGHLRGTFSGTAETFFGDSVITVTNGSFDVPVLSGSALGLDRAAARSTRLFSRHAKKP